MADVSPCWADVYKASVSPRPASPPVGSAASAERHPCYRYLNIPPDDGRAIDQRRREEHQQHVSAAGAEFRSGLARREGTFRRRGAGLVNVLAALRSSALRCAKKLSLVEGSRALPARGCGEAAAHRRGGRAGCAAGAPPRSTIAAARLAPAAAFRSAAAS
jgi:hypothetical protein